jgi:predicted MarR family transcription regulator
MANQMQKKQTVSAAEKMVLERRTWLMGMTHHDVMTTEFEWATIRFQQAFERHAMQIAHLSGLGDLSFSEIIVLHVLGLLGVPTTVGVLARQINADAVTNIQYCLRKLDGYKLVSKSREAKSKLQTYEVTPKGLELIKRYAYFRQLALTEQTKAIEAIDSRLAETTQLISLLTGVYDEAMRISATFKLAAEDGSLP